MITCARARGIDSWQLKDAMNGALVIGQKLCAKPSAVGHKYGWLPARSYVECFAFCVFF